ncbi:MAG TPA: sulfurtransferase [Gemmataceae bacterium]|nr:sulfurtransferase [Gemmataceae bacterium]
MNVKPNSVPRGEAMRVILLSTILLAANGITNGDAVSEPAQYPRANLLVEASDLARPEFAKESQILDARGKQKYAAGHIPGAIWVDAIGWNRSPLTSENQEPWAKRIGALGIDPDRRVVVYDDNANKDGARIWWILRYFGFRDVRLLNGGWRAWQQSGGRVSTEETKPSPRKLVLSPVAARLATKDQVLDALKSKDVQIVDARSRGEYCGEEGSAKRGGAIPGAVHLEWLEVLDDKSQRFKRPEELSELFRKKGITVDRPAITYCQSGGRAAVMAFALELMGDDRVRNYYKSWAEWGNAEDTPIIKPPK